MATVGTDPQANVIGSIRFVPHVEFHARISLNFEPIERRVSDATSVKIGRYNDKALPKAPISFKSKVVSRQHAEVWCEAGTWYIRDNKSSSGTFLNHVRLSPPGQESKPAVLVDGDSVQFGIDFRGGTEEVYRCVRTRVEINRVFEQVNAKFNRAAQKTLKSLTQSMPGSAASGQAKPRLSMDDGASTYVAECCICLFNIAPSQALFVAPCSHAYHFKCIRPLVLQNYPNFLCCVCRKYADLEANVETESEAWNRSASDDPRTPMNEEQPPFPALTTVVSGSASSPVSDRETTLGRTQTAVQHTSAAEAAETEQVTSPAATTEPVALAGRLRAMTLEGVSVATPVNESGPYLVER